MTALAREQLATREAKIKVLVEQDKRDEAGKILFDLITDCARGGDLDNANRLRDMLYEVDPMALTNIIKANEMIEEAMSGSISEEFTKAWAGLREALTEEEFLALYHSLEQHEVDEGKAVVKAGSKLDALFFVTKGNMRVLSDCIGNKKEIKTLEPGTMIGENCFQPSIWTVSVVTVTPVELFVLRQKKLLELTEKFPGIENKLLSYYGQFDTVPQLLEEKELKRRRHDRFKVDHKLTFQIVGSDGTPAERSFRGELDNISQGGLAFLMRIVKRENRWQLFGRRLLVTVKFEETNLHFKGVVVAVTVQDLQNHDYAVHIGFDQPVAEEVIKPLIPPEPIEEELPGEDEATDGNQVAGSGVEGEE